MKYLKKYFFILCAIIAIAMSCSSCINFNRYYYDDDEWSYGEFGLNDQSLINSEIDLDDQER